MARRPRSICRQPGCGALIDAPGHCERHKDQASGWRRSNRGKSAEERGYGWAWKKKRERILQRDRGLCQECLRAGRVSMATEVDHVLNRARGGTDDDSNLQSICGDCHKIKTARERIK
ncbi:HNH endonuclease [Noviherbaspirillum saxi]|uniref:Putative HNH nuclease YajD n=1 Tax=Noviherbaspirillum saxi TaxID=2320863 RepID=A0A3A3FS42_9BURK|nr:HNH endonuclease [Noviherbaspirillum saxi]RJF99027.1 HNH endonuclease [Noviherbaspirillum saxi]